MPKVELVFSEIKDAADLANFLADCAKVVDLKGLLVINEGHNDPVHGAYLLQDTLEDGTTIHHIEHWA